jgi:hypothetical protein
MTEPRTPVRDAHVGAPSRRYVALLKALAASAAGGCERDEQILAHLLERHVGDVRMRPITGRRCA